MNNSPDIRSHFSFLITPFTRELDVSQRWKSPIFERPLQALIEVVEERMLGAISAPPGTGKSMVLRTLQEESLSTARFRVRYISLCGLSKKEFCRELCVTLGCDPKGHLSTLVRRIQDRCLNLMDQESIRPVLLLDEVHDMKGEVLSMLRILTNFSMDSRLVLSIVLSGQNPLKTLLYREELEAITLRLSHVDTLRLLNREESIDYIRHRLLIGGVDRELFTPHALEAIFECAQGNLRATNHLCLKSLRIAASLRSSSVEPAHVAQARLKLSP